MAPLAAGCSRGGDDFEFRVVRFASRLWAPPVTLANPGWHSGVRGRVLTFRHAPSGPDDGDCYRYFEDGVVLMTDGRITAVGPASELAPVTPRGLVLAHYPDCLILPGFIDLHIHLPQARVIASFGAQLLDWLERYVFPEEAKFADPAHAAAGARFLIDELFRNGTTTAVVYGSVHPQSAEALFQEADRRGACMIAGKVMMDRAAPQAVLDTEQSSYDDSKALIERWHGRGRLRYAITPRFVITSSEAQFAATTALFDEFPDTYLQTHLAENPGEVALVKSMFPAARDYVDIYDGHGLLSPRSLFGHCVHLTERECDRLSESGSVSVFCPTSNLFLGSGLFDLDRMRSRAKPVTVGLATDVGGGTSYSMPRTAAEAYKVLQLRGQSLSALDALHMMTRGNAQALGLEAEIGSIEPGCYGDLVVLDSRATPAMAHRMTNQDGGLTEELFALLTLGDDRMVRATYVRGRCVHAPEEAEQPWSADRRAAS
jgi:guanine deaminase